MISNQPYNKKFDTLSFENAQKIAASLDADLKAASEALKPLSKLGNGLTPDHVKITPEWQSAKAAFERAFSKAKVFNALYVTKFKKELAKVRSEARK
ncbi:hypothetical protein [Undibacterium sp.]|uniref:hypothetical protein n=1 Tax=Undibacterium sp. TaxID=1914977 RepID=UPI003753188F